MAMKRSKLQAQLKVEVRAVLLGLFLVLLFSASVGADSLAELQTVEDVFQRGLDVSDALVGSRLQVRQAELSLTELEATLKPQLVFNAEHNRQSAALNPLSALQGWQSDDVIWDAQASLTVVQQLGANPQLAGGLSQAQLGVTAADIQERQALSDTLLTIQESYFGLLQAYQGLQVAEAAYSNAQAGLAVVQDQQRQGTATDLDRMREHNAAYQSESQLQAAEGGFVMAATRLFQLLALPGISDDYAKDWTARHLEHWQTAPEPWLPEFDSAWNYAQKHRTDLLSLEQQVRLAEIQYQAKQAERDWTISLSGTYLWDDWVFNGALNSDQTLMATTARRWQKESGVSLIGGVLPEGPWQDLDPEDRPPWLQDWLDGWQLPADDASTDGTNPWQIGLTFQYRFGDGGAAKAAIERLRHGITARELQRSQAEEMIYLDVLSRYQQLQQAYRAWVGAVDYYEEAKSMWDNLQETAARGLLSARDAEEADLLLQQSAQQLLQRRLAYEQSMAEFAAALGIDGEQMLEAMISGVWSALP